MLSACYHSVLFFIFKILKYKIIQKGEWKKGVMPSCADRWRRVRKYFPLVSEKAFHTCIDRMQQIHLAPPAAVHSTVCREQMAPGEVCDADLERSGWNYSGRN